MNAQASLSPKILMPPCYYRLLIKLAKPLYRLHLWMKRHQLMLYDKQIEDRFVKDDAHHFFSLSKKGVIWCHAVSLGELNTAYPLLRLLLDDGYGLYITSTTTTGYARARVLFAHEIEQGLLAHGFVPVDDINTIHRFVDRIQPCLAIFIETELWANTLYVLKQRGIFCAMMNARLVQKSLLKYQKFAKLSHSMMSNLSLVVAQDETSCRHFLALGLDDDKLCQAYSLKWASAPSLTAEMMTYADNLRRNLTYRFVWTAGSTHAGEEAYCLDAHKILMAQNKSKPLLIIVPRHFERFDEVYALCCASGLQVGRESAGEMIDDTMDVYLADSMGRLMLYYRVCDVAFVGGSLIDKGGHTPIEPLTQAKPVIMGHYVQNAQVLVDELKDEALVIVHNLPQLSCALMEWMNHPDKAYLMGQAGKRIVESRRHCAYMQKTYLYDVWQKQHKSV